MAQPNYYGQQPLYPTAMPPANPQPRLHALSLEETFQLRAQFALYDADGNGFLTVTELQNMLRVMNFRYNDDFIVKLFAMTFAMRGRKEHVSSTSGVTSDVGTTAVAELISRGLTIEEVMLFMQIFLTIHNMVGAQIKKEFENIVQGQVELTTELMHILTELVEMDENDNINLKAVRTELHLALGEETPLESSNLVQTAPADEIAHKNENLITDDGAKTNSETANKQIVSTSLTHEIWPSLSNSAPVRIPQTVVETKEIQSIEQSNIPFVNSGTDSVKQSTTRGAFLDLKQIPGPTPPYPLDYPKVDCSAKEPSDGLKSINKDKPEEQPKGKLVITAKPLESLNQQDILMLQDRARLLDEENDFLDQSLALFSRFFDMKKQGSFAVPDAKRCLNALGLPPSESSLRLLATRQGNDRVSWEQFKILYRYLLVVHASKGYEMHRIRAFFQQIDANGDGTISHDEFYGGIQDLFNLPSDDSQSTTDNIGSSNLVPGCNLPEAFDHGKNGAELSRIQRVARQKSRLSGFEPTLQMNSSSGLIVNNPQSVSFDAFKDALIPHETKNHGDYVVSGMKVPKTTLTEKDVELLFALADLDEDGTISLEEFIYLFGQLGCSSSQEGTTALAQRVSMLHDPMTPIPTETLSIQEDVSLLLLLKLIRAKLPSPLESIYDFIFAPAHYRPPLFAVLDGHPWYTLATRVIPKIDHTGIGYANLRPNPALAIASEKDGGSTIPGTLVPTKLRAAVVHSSASTALPLSTILPLAGTQSSLTSLSHAEKLQVKLLRPAAPLRPLPTSLSTKNSSGGGVGSSLIASSASAGNKRATIGPGITEPPLGIAPNSITCRILDSIRSQPSYVAGPPGSFADSASFFSSLQTNVNTTNQIAGSSATLPNPPGTSIYHSSIASGVAAAGIVKLPPSAAAMSMQVQNATRNSEKSTQKNAGEIAWNNSMPAKAISMRGPSVTAAAQAQALSTLQEASAGSWLTANPSAALRGDEIGKWGEFAPACAFEVTMLGIEGLPSPAPRIADAVAGARVRALLFDNRRPVSNIHTIKAKLNLPGLPGAGKLAPAQQEHQISVAEWTFPEPNLEPNGKGDVDWHQFIAKTDRNNTSLVFELSLLLKRRENRGLAGARSAPTATALRAHRNMLLGHSHNPADYYELSAGWAQLDISLQDLLDTAKLPTREIELPVHAGSFFAAEAVSPYESAAGENSPLGLVFYSKKSKKYEKSQAPDPVMRIRITPLEQIKAGRRIKELIMHAPVDALFPTNTTRVLRLARELIRDELAEGVSFLNTNQEGPGFLSEFYSLISGSHSSSSESESVGGGQACTLSLNTVNSSAIRVLMFLLSQQDALQAFCELWEKARSTIPLLRRRDDGGSSSNSTRELFRRSLVKMLPALSASARSTPPLIVGVTDFDRLHFFRSIADDKTDPFVCLSNDNLSPGWVRGRGMVSNHAPASVGTLRPLSGPARSEQIMNHVANNYSTRLRAVDLAEDDVNERTFTGEMFAGPIPLAYQLSHRPFHTSDVIFDPVGRLGADRWRVLNHAHAIPRTELVESLQSAVLHQGNQT